jgi:hypothetical protein
MLEAWKPLNQWDHPEIAAAMQNLCEVTDKEGAKGSVVLISGTLGFVRKLLPWLTDLEGKAPILIFVEGAGRRPVLPEGVGLVWMRISHQ